MSGPESDFPIPLRAPPCEFQGLLCRAFLERLRLGDTLAQSVFSNFMGDLHRNALLRHGSALSVTGPATEKQSKFNPLAVSDRLSAENLPASVHPLEPVLIQLDRDRSV